MEEYKIDFSPLEKLNLAPVPEDLELESVAEANDSLKQDENNILEEAKAAAIAEVESIEDLTEPVAPVETTVETNETTETNLEEEITPESKSVDNKDEEISVIQGIAEYAKAKGIIDYEDSDFQDSEDWLESKLIEKSKKYSDEWKDGLPPVIKEIIDNYEEGVPLDALIYSKSREIEYSGLEESQLDEDVELQKRLVEDWLATQDFEDKEISSKIKKYEDALILEDEAKTALKKLKAYEAKYQQELKARAVEEKKSQQEQVQKIYQKIESDIMGADEIIPGIKVDKTQKQKIYEAYTKADSKGETALVKAIKNDPNAWYKITQFMVLMNGDLKNVEKFLKSQAAANVKNTVTTYKESPGLSKLSSPSALAAMKKAIEKAKKS